jgi:hypothetical protein
VFCLCRPCPTFRVQGTGARGHRRTNEGPARSTRLPFLPGVFAGSSPGGCRGWPRGHPNLTATFEPWLCSSTCGPELDHTHHSEVDAVVSVPRRRAPQPSARTPASNLSVRVNRAQGPEGGRSSSYPRYVTPDASGGEFPGVTQPPGFDRVTTDRVSERDSRAVSSIREGLVKCALCYP